jgi:signal transduction histidine kinase
MSHDLLARFPGRMLPGRRWRPPTLLTGLMLASVASVVLIGILLFVGIDHFVSQRFADFAADRRTQAAQQVRDTVARELVALRNLGELLSHDAELNNATYYHLYLEGEAKHPLAAVRRMGEAFRLDAVRLWDSDGRLVAGWPSAPPAVAPPDDVTRGQAQLAWLGGEPWLVATAPLIRAGNPMALLWLGRPLARVLAESFPSGGEVSVRLARAGDPSGAAQQRVRIVPVAGAPVWIDLRVDDSVGRALAAVKRLLAWLLPAAGLLLAALLGFALRRQLAPLAQLTAAAAAVGRGEFAPVPAVAGDNEIARLVRAFNTMTGDLARLRELERRMQQQERLSSIGRMAARIAHDVNNPLSVIRGVAELNLRQAERDGDEGALSDHRLILHHVERCMRSVDQLLAYGRPVRLQPETADLGAVVSGIAERWRKQHPEADLLLTLPAAALPCEVDPYQFERVLENLLDNAREAAAGSIRVSLSRAHPWLELRVRDSGPGFPPEIRAHLFEPFHTTKRGGSGLGLASALAIVQAHGGEMAVGDGNAGEVIVRLPPQVQRAGR